MLTNKETFNYLKTIEKALESRAKQISFTNRLELDDVRSSLYLTSFRMFKRSFNPNKSKAITFFLNYCVRRGKLEVLMDAGLIRYPYHIVEKGLSKKYSYLSLDMGITDEDDISLHDIIEGKYDCVTNDYENRNYLKDLLNNSKLSDREMYIIKSHYGINSKPKTYKEIGEEYNLSKERISQLEKRAFKKIRACNNIGV